MRKRQEFQVSGLERLEGRVVLRGGPTITGGAAAALISQAYTAFELDVQQDIQDFSDDITGAAVNGIPTAVVNRAGTRFVFADAISPQQAFLNYFSALQGQINTLASQLAGGLGSLGVRAQTRTQLNNAIAAQITGATSNGVNVASPFPITGSLFKTLLSTGPQDAVAISPRVNPVTGAITSNKGAIAFQRLLGQSSINAIEQSRVALTIQAQAIIRVSRAIHHR